MALRRPRPTVYHPLAALAFVAQPHCAATTPEARPTHALDPTEPPPFCQTDAWGACEASALGSLRTVEARVQAAWWDVTQELARDRAARDLIAVHCRDEKLSRLTALRRLVEAHGQRLRERLAARDREGVLHELALLRAAQAHAEEALDQSRQCIGGGVARVSTVDPRRQV
jgi:hypothetical protein